MSASVHAQLAFLTKQHNALQEKLAAEIELNAQLMARLAIAEDEIVRLSGARTERDALRAELDGLDIKVAP